MTKILFGQSYFLRFDPKLWAAMQPYPPLGTLYAASYVRARGYAAALFDAMLAEGEADWDAALERERPDFAVIYEDNFNYLSKMCLLRMREAARTMTGMARGRGIPVIVAGSDASDHAAVYLEAGADYVLIGEGEETLGELLDALTGRSDMKPDQILGLAFNQESGNGNQERGVIPNTFASLSVNSARNLRAVSNAVIPNEVRNLRAGLLESVLEISPGASTERSRSGRNDIMSNGRRPDIRALDAIPFPAWDLVDVEKYRQAWLARHGYFSMNMVTTRGCPYHCNWCAKPIWGQRYNSRSPENVAAEMKWLKETYHPDHIWFADDIMGLKPGWLAAFADAVEREGARIPFKSLSRVDLLLREGDIPALQRAGADIIWVGAESGAQSVLTAMEKGTRVEEIYEARRRLREAGLRVGFFLQFGYPGETRADIEATLQMVRDLLPDDIGMSVSYPLPGTKFFARVQDQLGVKQNWDDSADLAMMYDGPFATAFYRQLHIVLHKEYRARKTFRHWRQAGLRELAAMLFHTVTLPLARFKLNRLAKAPLRSVTLAGEGLSLEEAARPTGQG